MKNKKTFALITIILMLAQNIWYSVLTVQGIIHPTIMTWIMFSIAVSLSFFTYSSSKKHNIIDNVCNTGDLFFVLAVTLIIIFFGKEVRFTVNIFEIVCIFLSLVILIFWRITKSHEISNIFLQGVMIIAYLPTFYQLLNSSKTSEPVMPWIIVWLASLNGIITGVMGKDKLAIIYASRTFVLVSVMIFLILRL